jgi:hypothetical protein
VKMTLRRTVTRDECPWLDEDLPQGTEVFTFHGPTYGCISPDGRAVSAVEDETPFFEVPYDALTESPLRESRDDGYNVRIRTETLRRAT